MHLVLGRNLNIFLMGWVTGYPGRVGLTRKKIESSVSTSGQKNRVWVKYFSGQVRKF